MKKLLIICLAIFSFASLAQESLPIKYRNIGPFRGGRSVAVSGVVGDPFTYSWAPLAMEFGKLRTQVDFERIFRLHSCYILCLLTGFSLETGFSSPSLPA